MTASLPSNVGGHNRKTKHRDSRVQHDRKLGIVFPKLHAHARPRPFLIIPRCNVPLQCEWTWTWVIRLLGVRGDEVSRCVASGRRCVPAPSHTTLMTLF